MHSSHIKLHFTLYSSTVQFGTYEYPRRTWFQPKTHPGASWAPHLECVLGNYVHILCKQYIIARMQDGEVFFSKYLRNEIENKQLT